MHFFGGKKVGQHRSSLTFEGAQAAQFFAEHAGITSFVTTTVNKASFFPAIESLPATGTKIPYS